MIDHKSYGKFLSTYFKHRWCNLKVIHEFVLKSKLQDPPCWEHCISRDSHLISVDSSPVFSQLHLNPSIISFFLIMSIAALIHAFSSFLITQFHHYTYTVYDGYHSFSCPHSITDACLLLQLTATSIQLSTLIVAKYKMQLSYNPINWAAAQGKGITTKVHYHFSSR